MMQMAIEAINRNLMKMNESGEKTLSWSLVMIKVDDQSVTVVSNAISGTNALLTMLDDAGTESGRFKTRR